MTPFGKIVFLISIIFIYGANNLVPSRVAAEDAMDGDEQVGLFQNLKGSQLEKIKKSIPDMSLPWKFIGMKQLV